MIQLSKGEIQELQKLHYERFRLVNPVVSVLQWQNKDQEDDFFGGGNNQRKFGEPIELFCDFSWDRKLKEYKDGLWLRTNNIELVFPFAQIQELGITLKIGDVVKMQDQYHVMNSVEPTNLINGTQFDYLDVMAIIDTKETTTP